MSVLGPRSTGGKAQGICILASFPSNFAYKFENLCFTLWVISRFVFPNPTARGSNQSILKEISPGCSLEGLMLKLKLQYFGHLMRRVDLLEKTLMLGGIGGRRRRGRQRMRCWMTSPTRWMWVWVNSGSWWWTGRPGVLPFMGSQRVGQDWATELNWILGGFSNWGFFGAPHIQPGLVHLAKVVRKEGAVTKQRKVLKLSPDFAFC